MAVRVLRRQCKPPQFTLHYTPRTLVPMEALYTDAAGHTVYGCTTPTTTTTTTKCLSPQAQCNHAAAANSAAACAAGASKTPSIPIFSASEIIPSLLYLGDRADATPAALRARGIKHVLNVAAECETPTTSAPEEFTVHHVYLRDHSDEDLSAQLNDCVEWIRRVVHDLHQPVLVHCRMGFSRSASIVMAFLIRYGPTMSQQGGQGQPMPNPPAKEEKKQTTEEERCAAAAMSFEDAFDFVKQRRPLVSPNLGFVLTLRDWAILQYCNSIANGWLSN